MLGVKQLRLDARVGEGLPGGVPVDAGRLHGGRPDPVAGQPGDEGLQAARQRVECAGLGLRLGSGRVSEPDGGGDVSLVHVESRGAGMDNAQLVVHHRFASC